MTYYFHPLKTVLSVLIEMGALFWFLKPVQGSAGKVRLISGYILCGIFLYWVMVAQLQSYLDFTLRVLLPMLVLRFCYEQSLRNTVYYSFVFFLCVGMCTSFLSGPLLLGFGIDISLIRDASPLSSWLYAVFIGVCKFAMVTLVRSCLHMREINFRSTAQILAICFPTVLFAYVRHELYRYAGGGDFTTTLSIMALSLFVFTFVLTISVEDNSYYTQKSEEEKRLHSQLQRQYEELLQQGKNNEAIRRMYHDIENHLACIRALSNNKDVEEYIRSIEEEMNRSQPVFNTGNAIVDIVLRGKVQEAHSRGVELEVFADASLAGFMDSVDICSLFSNALDNAIDASAKVEDADKRNVIVKTACVGRYFVVKISNFFVGKLFYQYGRLQTTKLDKTSHGIGIKGIEQTLKKYDGTLEISTEDDYFTTQMTIPLPQSSL